METWDGNKMETGRFVGLLPALSDLRTYRARGNKIIPKEIKCKRLRKVIRTGKMPRLFFRAR